MHLLNQTDAKNKIRRNMWSNSNICFNVESALLARASRIKKFNKMPKMPTRHGVKQRIKIIERKKTRSKITVFLKSQRYLPARK